MSLKSFPQINESAPIYASNLDSSNNFIRTKQEEIIRELRKEIDKLRFENSDLKFNLYVPRDLVQKSILHNQNDSLPKIDNRSESRSSTKSIKPVIISSDDQPEACTSVECKRLENELEAARNMIEDLNWIKVHSESRIHNQELKIQELQREIKLLKSTELEIVQLQIPGIVSSSRCSMASPSQTSGKRRSASLNRRGSTQSVLPNNYKESVATLPPISKARPT